LSIEEAGFEKETYKAVARWLAIEI
jgi:hypothetical protein